MNNHYLHRYYHNYFTKKNQMIRKTIYFGILLTGLLFMISCNGEAKKEEAKKEEKQEIKKEVKKDGLSEEAKADYMKKGMAIAKSSGKTLKSRLTAAVNKGGLQNGINTCNKVAQKMMDSLSVVYNAKIKRTTLKLRNEKDKPDQDELAVLSKFSKMMGDNKKPKPEVKQLASGEVRFYAPIMIDKVCLNCHGKIGENVKPQNYDVIKKHYPNDEAIDYKEGDLRGIWSITFKK